MKRQVGRNIPWVNRVIFTAIVARTNFGTLHIKVDALTFPHVAFTNSTGVDEVLMRSAETLTYERATGIVN